MAVCPTVCTCPCIKKKQENNLTLKNFPLIKTTKQIEINPATTKQNKTYQLHFICNLLQQIT